MTMISNIVCKTAGVAGLSFAVYDAVAMAKHHSEAETANVSADIFESIVAAERSNSTASASTNAMQQKVADFRMTNPIVPLFGKIKGFVQGFFSSLGDNIVPVVLSSIALAAKGVTQKFGAWGLAIYSGYLLAKEGFGLGKTSPVDK